MFGHRHVEVLEMRCDVGCGAGRVVSDEMERHSMRAKVRKEFLGAWNCPVTLIDHAIEVDEKGVPVREKFGERV